ncbi:MAG: RnfABCDGE type electron transport complex subunit B [Planctomycetota bacterium]
MFETITIILAAVAMLGLAVAMAWVLGWANRAFHVEVDPRIDEVNEVLPGANCGGCGYVGCGEYAEAVVTGDAPPDACPVGGAECANQIATILGVELGEALPYRPVVHCGATTEQRLKRHDYGGERTCAAANLVSGVQGCTYGCLGFGDCETICPYDAIHVIDGLATVDYDKCIGCGKCEKVCPRHIISMVPFKQEQMLVIKCSNKDFGKDVKAVCEVGCLGCKACTRVLDGLLEMKNNLPQVDYEQYTADEDAVEKIGQAIEKCPMKRLEYVGSPSDAEKAAAEGDVPEVVTPNFKTTVDDTEWHG